MIIGNLVENAFYYTPAAGTVTVHSSPMDKDKLLVIIEDTGMGIPKTQQAFVFSRFNRAPAAVKANAEGSGLGLYFVKRILERCGGEITFTSTEGKGSTFRIVLPKETAFVRHKEPGRIS